MELDMYTPSKREKFSSKDDNDLRRGPWTLEEDDILIKLIANHGEGRWNLLAMSSGLRRTGKSCRLRWLNYLKPDIKRGNLTSEEQLLIFELHSKWGNRWSAIARHLPGRTDNEIKNYWKTKIQKEAKRLKINTNETRFLENVEPLRMIKCLENSKESSTSTPLPLNGVSHHSANEGGPNYLDHYEQNSYTMNSNDLWLPSLESANISNMTQPLGYTTSQFQALDNNEIGIYANDDYLIFNNAFDEMDYLNLTTISSCQISESNWLDEEFACNIWNMN